MDTFSRRRSNRFATNTTKPTLLPFHHHLSPLSLSKIPLQTQQAVLAADTTPPMCRHDVSSSRERDFDGAPALTRRIAVRRAALQASFLGSFGRRQANSVSDASSSESRRCFSTLGLLPPSSRRTAALSLRHDVWTSREQEFKIENFSAARPSSPPPRPQIKNLIFGRPPSNASADNPLRKFEILRSGELPLSSIVSRLFSFRCAALNTTTSTKPSSRQLLKSPKAFFFAARLNGTDFLPLRGAVENCKFFQCLAVVLRCGSRSLLHSLDADFNKFVLTSKSSDPVA
ncbi:hypothetical protein R3P38DRAFT_2794773 [Favolaschia claudopus]|uniref:Uncharacterized protein n=1 Tax=Favolaschia claudopus TaxID=2862362 RepID=A0AAW0A7Z8_9AGAR